MNKYLVLNSKNSKGTLQISRNVFIDIAEKTLKTIPEIITFPTKENKKITTFDVSLNNNKISYKFNLVVLKDTDQEKIKETLKENLETALISTCEIIPTDIKIKITTLK